MTDEPQLTKQQYIDNLSGEINAFYRKEQKIPHDVLKRASKVKLQFISSGSIALDRALGGGLGRGRCVEYVGELSTLKTYFAQKALANAQEAGMLTAFLDTEGTFEAARAEALGVDTDELQMVDRRLRGDQQLDVVCSLLDQGNFCVVVDSVAALLPKEEVERTLGEDTVARQASLMSRAMRKITHSNRSGVVIFINQLRESIGGLTFGPKTKAPGGKALGFYATQRVKFTRIETIQGERSRYEKGKLVTPKVPVAYMISAKVEKNKVGRPLQEAVFLFDLDSGMVDSAEEMLNLGLEFGLIKVDGSQHFVVTDTGKRVRYRNGILDHIRAESEMFETELTQLIRGTTPVVTPPPQEAPSAGET
jgi:recombination protein RecA